MTSPEPAKFVDDEGNFVDSAPKDGVYLFTGGVGRFLYDPKDAPYPGDPFAGMNGVVRCSRCGVRKSMSDVPAGRVCFDIVTQNSETIHCGGIYHEA